MALFIVERRDTGFTVRPGENTLQTAANALKAEGHAEDAAISAATAEAAAGPTFASTALGLAATTSGQAFAVDNGDGTVTVYLNSAGSAVAQRTLATTAALAASGGAGLVGLSQGGTVADKISWISLEQYGAIGDGVADDRAAILGAINAAYDLGGARIVGRQGGVYRFTGRIKLRPGVILDLGVNRQTPGAPPGKTGAYLLIADATGGVDLVAGSHLVATIRVPSGAFTGPALDINDTKSTELNFGRNERAATFDVDILGNFQAGSMGVRLYSGTTSGTSWVKGTGTVGGLDYPFTLEANGTNAYVNENWLDLISYGAVEALRGLTTGSGASVDGNRINITVQPGGASRAKRAIRWDGVGNWINIMVWDWSTANVDASAGGTQIELTSSSGGNIIDGFISRATGSGNFPRNPIIDYAPRNTSRNIIRTMSGRHRSDLSPISLAPANTNQRVFVGDQDDSFAFAYSRYTVTASGTTPPDATSLGRLFDLSGANLQVNPCTDFTVNLDLGVAPTGVIGMGLVMVRGVMPDRIRVEGSTDNVTFVTVLEAGWAGDLVPTHLFRDDGAGNYRYWKLTVENDTAKRVDINRWWCADVGFTRLPGAFAPVLNPKFAGVVTVGSQQVVRDRRTGWTADSGTAKRTSNTTYSGTAEAAYTQATIQALMNAVRDQSQAIKALKDDLISHGLIGT